MSEFANDVQIMSLAMLGVIGSEADQGHRPTAFARAAIQELAFRVAHDRKRAEALLDFHVSAFKANPTREGWYKTLALLLAVSATGADLENRDAVIYGGI